MLTLILAIAINPSACPITIGIGGDGTLFSNRFGGWYKISSRTLDSDLHGGCYNDAHPIPVTSVKLFVAPHAPKLRVDLAFSILGRDGWGREKVRAESWSEYPQAPSTSAILRP